MFDFQPLPHYFSPEHEQFRNTLRNFVAREITPFVNAWDEAGTRNKRIDREVKVMMIGGGSEEILKDLAARQLGI